MSRFYSLNALDMRRWRIVKGTTYRAPVSPRNVAIETNGRHGEIPVGLPTYSVPSVALELVPGMAESAAALEMLNDDLAALAGSPSLVLSRTVDGVTREAAARLVSMDWDTGIEWGIWSGVSIVLALPGVFFRDPTPTNVTIPAGSSSHTVLAGSGPITDAVVRFVASGAAVKTLTDTATETAISVDQGGTGYIYVDCATLQAWQTESASAWTPAGADVSAKVGYPGAGRLQLWPSLAGSARSVSVHSTHAAVVRARRAWL